jgi:hypothetical protein
VLNDSLFLATSQGVIVGDLRGTINLKDFRNWKRYGAGDGIDPGPVLQIAEFENSIYTGRDSVGLFQYATGSWIQLDELQSRAYSYIGSSDNSLFIISNDEIWENTSGVFSLIESTLSDSPREIVRQDGARYVASSSNGVVEISQGETAIFPTGPYSDSNFRAFYDDDITIVPGGFDDQLNPVGISSGYYTFTDGEWINFNADDPDNSVSIPEFPDITGYGKIGDDSYLSSYGYGLLRMDANGSSEIINENTPGSLLENLLPGENGVFITGIASSDGLWILNYGASRPYKFWSTDNTWSEFQFPGGASQFPVNIEVGPNGDCWVILDENNGGGILVFDKDGTRSRVLSTSPGNGNLPSNAVNSIRFDKEGQAWVATKAGIVFFPFAAFVLEGDEVDGVAPIYESRLLFDGEDVTALEIDGGDRKWMATGANLWLFDKNINTLLKNFSPENSPIYDERIYDLRINGGNGELFILSEGGILSYRTDATDGEAVHDRDIVIFPNPVRLRDFSGVVTVNGLAENAYVKVTDMAGRLVWQTRSNGGTFSWDLRSLSGEIPQTGIYLILSSTPDGSDTVIGKLALVN